MEEQQQEEEEAAVMVAGLQFGCCRCSEPRDDILDLGSGVEVVCRGHPGDVHVGRGHLHKEGQEKPVRRLLVW